jgi:thymidylate synthase
MPTYRDIESAFLGELRSLVEDGTDVEVRGHLTRELNARLVQVENVRERYLLVPNRHNNVFASIAESLWVIAGRNDLGYLSAYLPRAREYSDDGETWRAAYGPRLRNWNGVDQLAEVVSILRADLTSRRAVAVLYDPDRDFIQSNDIPCNNWLHFIVREGRVDLHVAARSTDIWWGFSGINAFEWTLLLEMVAHWLRQEPGHLVFFTSSMHLYERHFEKAGRVLRHQSSEHYEDDLRNQLPAFETPWESFTAEISEWMRVEQGMRSGRDLCHLDCSLTDPLLTSYAQMIDLFWMFKRREDSGVIEERLAAISDATLREVAAEFLNRRRGQFH